MSLSTLTWIKDHRRPISMLVLVLLGYIIRKTIPMAHDELELLDAIWTVVGFGAVLTPNFSQAKEQK